MPSPQAVVDAPSRATARPWWLLPSAIGALLLLAAVGGTALTSREPDPLFLHAWWTPVARAPAVALLLGSCGLDLLLATGIVAGIAPVTRRRVRPMALVTATIVLAGLVAGGWALDAGRLAGASGSAAEGALRPGSPAATPASAEARRAIRLVLAWPTTPTSRVHVRTLAAAPAGPWIVQTTEVVNENAQDEGADVVVGTLVDPISGRIDAAWFFGL